MKQARKHSAEIKATIKPILRLSQVTVRIFFKLEPMICTYVRDQEHLEKQEELDFTKNT